MASGFFHQSLHKMFALCQERSSPPPCHVDVPGTLATFVSQQLLSSLGPRVSLTIPAVCTRPAAFASPAGQPVAIWVPCEWCLKGTSVAGPCRDQGVAGCLLQLAFSLEHSCPTKAAAELRRRAGEQRSLSGRQVPRDDRRARPLWPVCVLEAGGTGPASRATFSCGQMCSVCVFA